MPFKPMRLSKFVALFTFTTVKALEVVGLVVPNIAKPLALIVNGEVVESPCAVVELIENIARFAS